MYVAGELETVVCSREETSASIHTVRTGDYVRKFKFYLRNRMSGVMKVEE